MAQRTCSVEGCEKPRWSNGYCPMHLRRWKVYGDPLAMSPKRTPDLAVRVAFYTRKGAGADDCWMWTGATDADGYGKITVAGQSLRAHRLSYVAHVGDIPEGQVVCHRCDTPSCVRVDHLFLGSVADNNADKLSKGRGRPPVGERNRFSKITAVDVRAIRLAKASGALATDIAEEYGISVGTISDIVRRHTWKHIE